MLAQISRRLPSAEPPRDLGFVLGHAEVPGCGQLVQTRVGPRWIDPGLVISVPNGLAGFPGLMSFAGLQLDADRFGPFQLLQSLDDARVAFLVFPDRPGASLYAADHIVSACADESYDVSATAVLVIVNVRSDQGLSLNLRAPVLLETRRRLAVQHIMSDGDYPIRFVP